MKKLLTAFLGLAFLVGTIGCPSADKKKETPKGGATTPPAAAAPGGEKPAPAPTTPDKPKAP
jgi:hypothetical protein